MLKYLEFFTREAKRRKIGTFLVMILATHLESSTNNAYSNQVLQNY